jgi:AcrR family transcriptional regulator
MADNQRVMKRRSKQIRPEEVEETRSMILRVAQQLFMQSGYRAVSTRQLADACGLTQPALYHHFADKQAIFLAMAQDELARMHVALDRIVHRNEPPQERMQRVAMFLLSTTHQGLNQMLHDIEHELAPELRAELEVGFLQGIVAPIASVLEDGQRQGVVRGPLQGGADPRTVTFLFMSMISQTVSSRYGVGADPTRAAEMITQLLFHGIAL